MTDMLNAKAMGADLARVDGLAKVTGTAPYAYEQHAHDTRAHAPLYVFPVQSRIARGRVLAVHSERTEALAGVVAVLTHENARRLEFVDDSAIAMIQVSDDPELSVLQTDEVHYRGQVIGAVIAETPEIAREGAGLVGVDYEERPHDSAFSADRTDLTEPQDANVRGDIDAAMAASAVTVDAVYSTPVEHNNPMEPHATTALWDGGELTVFEGSQAVHATRRVLANLFAVDPEKVHVIGAFVGGGFGAKASVHSPLVLACLAATHAEGRPVKLALTRRQMFELVGYRPPTVQRVRLGADDQGRISAVGDDVVTSTARMKQYVEQAAGSTAMMYAGENRSTGYRVARLDVSPATFMRAPGHAPGMFALEVAMDELAAACGIDPIELRVRNEPEVDPDSGLPYSSRGLLECLEEGARRFGWADRDPAPRTRRVDGWWVGTGVAASTFPAFTMPGSAARIRFVGDGRYEVAIAAADIGTGAGTILTQIAADALAVPVEDVVLSLGDTTLPTATVAGGSAGTSSWGSAVVEAGRAFTARFGAEPDPGAELTTTLERPPDTRALSANAFGAQFAEVRVHADTGEVRVPRLIGVFGAGRIINPRTARSQLVGGMVMGVSMALHEESVLDPRFGHVVNHDFGNYHIAANADIGALDAYWIDEHDPHVNAMGAKGIGEIGIVGTAAAIANAAYHATGVRVRDLPMTLDRFLA